KLKHSQITTFNQYHQGIKVYGKTVKIESTSGDQVRIWGNTSKKINIKPLSGIISPVKAILAVEKAYNTIIPLNQNLEMVILPFRTQAVAYIVNLYQNFKVFRVFVDAHDGTILMKTKGWFDSYGRVFLIDPARTPDASDVILNNLTADATYLDGYEGIFQVYNCLEAPEDSMMGTPNVEEADLESIPTSDASGNYLYDPDTGLNYTEYAGAVNLYYHVDRMYTHFNSLGYEIPNLIQIVANLHTTADGTSQPYENAYFTPSTNQTFDIITAGQGETIDLAYGGDVIMHEFSHSVIYHVAIDLNVAQFDRNGMNRMPLGIHEGLADYFPASLNNSSVMGEWALNQIQEGAARDLANNDKVCPDDMVGEEHMDGEIIGAATWAIRDILGGTGERSDELLYATLLRLNSASTYKDFYDSLVISVEDAISNSTITQQEGDDILTISQSKGLDICGRSIPLDQTRTNATFGLDQLGQMMGGDCAQMRSFLSTQSITLPTLFQYNIDIPEGTTSLTFNINFTSMSPGNDLQYKIFGRKDEMIGYDLVNVYGGFMLPSAKDYDKSWPASGDFTNDATSFTWTLQDVPPLPVGAEVYFAVTYANCPTTQLEVSAELSDEPVENPDAGVDADIEDDTIEDDSGNNNATDSEDGCKCSSVGGKKSGNTHLFLLSLAILGLTIFRRKFLTE
ncbi:MAG: hypothetical protein PF689_04490, partial [Deltaproteobacteria bacterium]|nr:hypothetical protein [Deltaproteobacteria bacterium]